MASEVIRSRMRFVFVEIVALNFAVTVVIVLMWPRREILHAQVISINACRTVA